MIITDKEKQDLLTISEWAIHSELIEKSEKDLFSFVDIGGILSELLGVFISVYVNNELRGCIGTFSEQQMLYENVIRMSKQAAFHDGRFEALKKQDFSNMRIEISVLSPRKRIYHPDQIEIGKHGIYLVYDQYHGTLLPQVAVKNNWNAVEFLEYCAFNKAGLKKGAWKDAELYVYEACVFS